MGAMIAASCYPSDLTDKEWALTEPLIPPAKRGGDRRTVKLREVVNASCEEDLT